VKLKLGKLFIKERMKIMNKEKFIAWISAAGVRAIKTFAQTAVALIGTTVAINQVDWTLVISTSALAGILSLLTSLAGLPELKAGVSE
jgi:ABC-type Na+ efflux pump permease subunit